MNSLASILTCLTPPIVVAPERSEFAGPEEATLDRAAALDGTHPSQRIHLFYNRKKRTPQNCLPEPASWLLVLPAITRRLAAAGVSVMFALLLLELGVRVFIPQHAGFYDGSEIRRISSTAPWIPENIPNGRNDSYTGVPVRINSLGLRGEEVAKAKPAHTIRIIGVGDSIAFGFGVREEQAAISVLGDELNRSANGHEKFQVLNAGVPGTGLDYYYHFLRTKAPQLNPDLVIVNICLNDIALYTDPKGPAKPPASRTLNRFLLRHSQLYLATYLSLKSILFATGILDLSKIDGGSFLPLEPRSASQERAWESTLGLLSNIADVARKEHIPLLFVVYPMEPQLSARMLQFYRTRLNATSLCAEALLGIPGKRISAFGLAQGIPVIDLLPAFQAAPGTMYLRNRSISFDPVHPSVLGHHMAAQQMFQFLSTPSGESMLANKQK
jgi:lysophospholipase L1-like esterase